MDQIFTLKIIVQKYLMEEGKLFAADVNLRAYYWVDKKIYRYVMKLMVKEGVSLNGIGMFKDV